MLNYVPCYSVRVQKITLALLNHHLQAHSAHCFFIIIKPLSVGLPKFYPPKKSHLRPKPQIQNYSVKASNYILLCSDYKLLGLRIPKYQHSK